MDNDNKGRISGDCVNLNMEKVHTFFEERTQKKLPHRYNYVIYQDSNPELAIERDKYEKNKMFPYMNIKEGSYVLDIGCGVGRWGDEIAPHLKQGGGYIGVDYSSNLIKIAEASAIVDSKRRFYIGAFQNISEVLSDNNEMRLYDLILVNGILMYLNDIDLIKCLENVDALLNVGGRIYIKESVGLKERFTLKDYYSDEMQVSYNAIYRSIAEYRHIFDKVFNNFRMIIAGETWKPEQENRAETTSWFWFYEKR